MKRQKLVCGYDGLDLLGPGLGNVRICLQFSDKELSRRTLSSPKVPTYNPSSENRTVAVDTLFTIEVGLGTGAIMSEWSYFGLQHTRQYHCRTAVAAVPNN